MKIEPVKVVAGATNLAVPAEQGVEKGKEGLSFAKTMENIMGLLEKAEPQLSLAKFPEDTTTPEGEVAPSFSPDIDLHTILLTPLGQGTAAPMPSAPTLLPLPEVAMPEGMALSRTNMDTSAQYGHETRTAHSATAYETAKVQTLAPTPTLSALPPAVNPVLLSPMATPVVELYPHEHGPLVPRDSIPPVRVEPMGVVTAKPWSGTGTAHSEATTLPIVPLANNFPSELKAPLTPSASPQVASRLMPDAPVAFNAQVFSVEPSLPAAPLPEAPLEAVGELSKVPPQLAVEQTVPTNMPRLHTEVVSLAAQPIRPKLTIEKSPPELNIVTNTPVPNNAQVFSAEAPLPAAPLVASEKSSMVLPPLREYGQGMVIATPPEVREAYSPKARSSYAATDNRQLDIAGTTAHTQRSAPPLTMEPLAPTFMQSLQTEIISFAAHPTRPELTLEITPPEYGKVIVSAERESGGQVVVRLITETPQAKAALLEHLPRSTPTLEVRVYTAEEYREHRDERQKEQTGERREQPAKQGKREERVEFKI